MFWLDVAEPGYATYDFDNYRYYLGTDLKVGNLYPNEFSKMVFDGLKEENKTPVTLIRGCWAGSQKYGTLVWSGDIDSSFGAFRNQVNTGLVGSIKTVLLNCCIVTLIPLLTLTNNPFSITSLKFLAF